MLDEEIAEVRLQHYKHTSEWHVIIMRRAAEIRYKCRDYDQAMKWARMECKSYRTSKIEIEHVDQSEGARQGDSAQDTRRMDYWSTLSVQARSIGGIVRPIVFGLPKWARAAIVAAPRK